MKHWDYGKTKEGTWQLAYSYDFLTYTKFKEYLELEDVKREYIKRNEEERSKELELWKVGR